MTEWIAIGIVLALLIVVLVILVLRGLRDEEVSFRFLGRLLHFSSKRTTPVARGEASWRTLQSWDVKPGDARNVGKIVEEYKFSRLWRIRYGTRPDPGAEDRRFRITIQRKGVPSSRRVVVDLREPKIARDRNGQEMSETGTFMIEVDAVTRWWTAVIEEQKPDG